MGNIPKSLTALKLKDWLNSKKEQPIVIDVRESLEVGIASLPFVDIYIPMSKVTSDYVSSLISKYLNKQFVILCHRGIRSYNFAQWLIENDLAEEVWNLEEGIDGWSVYVDSRIPRY
tara:strand:+ start:1210 stop:1560 length:351 start_codon:yes stop_codon:yes gene_type:complete